MPNIENNQALKQMSTNGLLIYMALILMLCIIYAVWSWKCYEKQAKVLTQEIIAFDFEDENLNLIKNQLQCKAKYIFAVDESKKLKLVKKASIIRLHKFIYKINTNYLTK
ncbi:MAG: hypothetical protein ACRC42_00835 [Mycoplasma sp.]